MASKPSQKKAIIILSIAIVLFLASIIVLAIFPVLYNTLLYKQISLVNNSLVFNIWRDLPLPIYQKLYFYNITNKEGFLKHNEKLNVTQVGPYTYTATWKKHNIQWHPNKTVTYEEMRTYQFSQNESSGMENDTIFTLNGPLIMASYILRNYNFLEKASLSALFSAKGERVITMKSIRELTYDGYKDFIIDWGTLLVPNMPFKDGIFSWLYGKNATYDGKFNVYTGESDIKKLNVIDNFNGQKKLNFWKNETCNMINGTSAEVSPPLDENQQDFTFFQSFFCRSVTFSYNGTDVTHKGVKTKRFIATEKSFGNETVNEDNFCFASETPMPSGVQDVSPCQFGAPVFLSFPHFYLADHSYSEAINDPATLEFDEPSHIDIEPTTGLSIDIKLNFQVNMKVNKVPSFLQFTNIPEGVFPILWAEFQVSLTDELADLLKTSLRTPKIITYSVLGVTFAIALVLLVISIVMFIKLKKNATERKQDDQPILKASSDSRSNLSNGIPRSISSSDSLRTQNSMPSDLASSNQSKSPEHSKLKSQPFPKDTLVDDEEDEALLDCGMTVNT